MNLKISYFDTIISFENRINSIEIENKGYFYMIVNEFNLLSNGELSDSLYFYDKNNLELKLNNKIFLLLDYFNISFDSKKYISNVNKMIINNINENDINKLSNYYSKIKNVIINSLDEIDLPLFIDENFDLDNILKILKVTILKNDSLFNNLLLIIDIEKLFNINQLIVFVNLKQYLNLDELEELYKYALYNNVNILLIDSQVYNKCIKNESKLVIDNDLNEYVV